MTWFKKFRQPADGVIAMIIERVSSTATADLFRAQWEDGNVRLKIRKDGCLELIHNTFEFNSFFDLYTFKILGGGLNTRLVLNNPGAGVDHFASYPRTFVVPGSNYTNGHAMEPLRIRGFKTTAGAPTTGTWDTGDILMDSNKVWWRCTSGGTPGTWA